VTWDTRVTVLPPLLSIISGNFSAISLSPLNLLRLAFFLSGELLFAVEAANQQNLAFDPLNRTKQSDFFRHDLPSANRLVRPLLFKYSISYLIYVNQIFKPKASHWGRKRVELRVRKNAKSGSLRRQLRCICPADIS